MHTVVSLMYIRCWNMWANRLHILMSWRLWLKMNDISRCMGIIYWKDKCRHGRCDLWLSSSLTLSCRTTPIGVSTELFKLPNDPHRGHRQCVKYESILFTPIPLIAPVSQGFSVVSVFSPSNPPNAHINPDLYDTTQCNCAFLLYD